MAAENPIGIEEMERIFNGGGVDLNQGDIAIRIGQTKEIDEAKIQSLMDELNTIKELKASYTSEREEVDKILVDTNSNAFANGDIAKANRRSVKEVQQDLETLSARIAELSNMVAVVKQYNEYVRKIKAGQKYQLLCAVAERVNAEAEHLRTTYKYAEKTAIQNADLPYYMKNKFSAGTEKELAGGWFTSKQKNDNSGNATYEITQHIVAYINYWGWDKHGKGQGPTWYKPWTWADDNTKELEGKIKTVGQRLGINLMPY